MEKKNGLDQAYSNGTRDKCIHFVSLVNTIRIYIVFFSFCIMKITGS